MTLKIATTLHNTTPHDVYRGFDEKLFVRLAPPFPLLKLLRFDGCNTGDLVHVQLDFLLFKQQWHAQIIDNQTHADKIFFIDQGTKLPFFLKYWRHTHHITPGTLPYTTIIIDDITYNTPLKILDFLMFPVLYAQFLYRKPIYKKIFNKI
jgi:ligand-binding SRPBCC domain-containing protein